MIYKMDSAIHPLNNWIPVVMTSICSNSIEVRLVGKVCAILAFSNTDIYSKLPIFRFSLFVQEASNQRKWSSAPSASGSCLFIADRYAL